jgi:endonuclease YncB( thermonuclease family)
LFFWRKRNEGFEWREYVRTTILVRRQERRQKLHDAKDAAVFGVKQAGRSSWRMIAAGSIRAGELALLALISMFEMIVRATRSAASVTTRGLSAVWHWLNDTLWPVLRSAALRTADRLAPLVEVLERPRIRKTLLGIGVITAVAAGGRITFVAADLQAKIAGGIAGLSLILVGLAMLLSRERAGSGSPDGRSVPGLLASVGEAVRRYLFPVLLPAGVLALAAWGIASNWPAGEGARKLETASIDQTDAHLLEGRAMAVSGDSLRVGGRLLKLAGVESPERDQICSRSDGSTWRCGAAARDAMARLLRSGRVMCTMTGDIEAGISLATCRSGQKDIAQELVRNGHVFAIRAIFSGYGSIENEAKAARLGVWSGEALRPSDYRAQKWEAAKRLAPDGCPIKGQLSGQNRTYVLPWSATYDRVRVRESRGERWFCSEAEAQAAGWRSAEQS